MRLVALDRLDRYMLRVFAGPLVSVLATLLLAQLLERLLRLLDLTVSAGAPLGGVLFMLANLVPHYLGLALPMSFAAAVFIAAARLSDASELDVMLANGRSVARITVPYLVLALLLVPFDLYLFGQLQPQTRYGYRVAVQEALQTGWDAKVEAHRFIDAGKNTVFSADTVEADGRSLKGVFVARRVQGVEEITAAERGRLVAGDDGRGLMLRLEDGMTVRAEDDDVIATYRFAHSKVDKDLSPAKQAPVARGDSVREQTFSELWQQMHQPDGAKAGAELHGRLARVLVLPLLPLLMLPLGMASKRGRRSPGVVFAVLALVALNHALQFGASLAGRGHVSAVWAIWAPFALFGFFSVWIFAGSLAWPGDNPVSRAVLATERLAEGLRWRRRAASAS